VLVTAVAGALEQILDNLLDNAMNVSAAGAAITVRIDRAGALTSVAVDDQGPGLSDDAKVRALGRFWKSDRTSEGTGLGLAIAQTLVEACGGRMELRDSVDGGLSVEVELPSA
jgi:signal transduction histidine kinase